MAVSVRPTAGEVVEETKRTRIVTEDYEQPTRKPPLPELWEQVELLPQTTDPSSPDYQFTIYRGQKAQRADEKEWLGKFHERMTREKIQEMFGGGVFNIWLKMRVGKGNALELKYNEDVRIGGDAKRSTVAGVAGSTTTAAMSNDPMIRMLDIFDRRMAAIEAKLDQTNGNGAVSKAVEQAVGLTGQVFSAATTAATGTLSRIAGGEGQGTHSRMETLMEKFLEASLTRMLAPPSTNSLQDTLQTLKLFKESGLIGGHDSKAGVALELVRQVPSVAATLVQGIQAWQGAEEARARTIAMVRGGGPSPVPVQQPAAAQPGQVLLMPDPQTKEQPQPGAPPPAPPVEIQVPQMPLETLEQMLCNIIADESNSIEQAATEACALIERCLPGQTDNMVAQGEDFILNLFRTRPVLRQVENHPRLGDFVKKFIEVVKSAPVMQPTNPAAPVA